MVDLFPYWDNAFTHFLNIYASELISGIQKSGVFKIWQIENDLIWDCTLNAMILYILVESKSNLTYPDLTFYIVI